MNGLLQDHEITLERIESLFKAAFLRTEYDKDGDLVIRDQGINTFVKIDSQRKMITFFSLWGLKERSPEIEKLKFANRLNDNLILVRFTVARPTTLWCDYAFMYEGGITSFQLINTYKRFMSVCQGASRQDTAGVMS